MATDACCNSDAGLLLVAEDGWVGGCYGLEQQYATLEGRKAWLSSDGVWL
jgi:hypothetical protein